jgi:hypothetical protein
MALVLTVVALPFAPPRAASGSPSPEQPFVKYYVVDESTAKETLAAVARRIFGDESRAGELYQLNAKRVQPDGDVLTRPTRLRAGWCLVLPWDAVGDDVRYGPLPDAENPSPPTIALPSVGPAAAAPSGDAGAGGGGLVLWAVLVVVAAVTVAVAGGVWWWWRRSARGGRRGPQPGA